MFILKYSQEDGILYMSKGKDSGKCNREGKGIQEKEAKEVKKRPRDFHVLKPCKKGSKSKECHTPMCQGKEALELTTGFSKVEICVHVKSNWDCSRENEKSAQLLEMYLCGILL